MAHHSCKICGTSVVNFKVCTPPVGWARDAPACNKCTIKGHHDGISTVFEKINCTPYSGINFKNKLISNHHTGSTILEDLNLNLVDQVVTDYMHTALLGTMKKLLHYWISGKDKDTRFQKNAIEEFDKNLLSFNNYIPTDFARKHRSVKELDRWKATELRLFLLYTGPVILQNFLP